MELLSDGENCSMMFSRFDTIPACDGQTDGHPETAQSALCTASRGKNAKFIASKDRIIRILILRAASDCFTCMLVSIALQRFFLTKFKDGFSYTTLHFTYLLTSIHTTMGKKTFICDLSFMDTNRDSLLNTDRNTLMDDFISDQSHCRASIRLRILFLALSFHAISQYRPKWNSTRLLQRFSNRQVYYCFNGFLNVPQVCS